MIRFANVDVWGPVTGGAQRFIPARRPPEGPCIAIKHIVNFTQRLPSFQCHDKPPQSRTLLPLVGVPLFFPLFSHQLTKGRVWRPERNRGALFALRYQDVWQVQSWGSILEALCVPGVASAWGGVVAYAARLSLRWPGFGLAPAWVLGRGALKDRKSTRLNSSHVAISYAVFCLKKKKKIQRTRARG